MSNASGGEDQDYLVKRCPTHGDLWDINGSCPRCDQDTSEGIRSGNWFATACALMLFCLPAFGQAAYSGLGLYSGSAVYGASVGAPAFFAALPLYWVDNTICNPPGGDLRHHRHPGNDQQYRTQQCRRLHWSPLCVDARRIRGCDEQLARQRR